MDKDNKKYKITAHNGKFHADDIFAAASLSIFLGEENVEIIRSRDEAVINSSDYVIDVGGVYDLKTNRFDHHQEGGAGERENSIPYASFGLVWKHFGEKICGSIEISKKIDRLLVQWIDATDNGVQIIESKVPDIYPYDIGLYFNTFTPDWKDKSESFDTGFFKALDVAKNILKREIQKRKNLIEARSIVEGVYNSTEDKRIIVLDEYYPSNETLSKFPEPLFIISPREDGFWNIKCVIDDESTFIYRKYFPENWGAKRDHELENESGVKGAIFCHRHRYIAANKTKEGAIEMAEIALNS